MSVEVLAAGATFAGLFVAWVVLPTHLKRRHTEKIEREDTKESV